MDRRESLKLLMLAAVGPSYLLRPGRAQGQVAAFASRWHEWPDVRWAGPEYWGNRLQDWSIENGVLVCGTQARHRTLHCLTHRATSAAFTTSVGLDPVHLAEAGDSTARCGFRVGTQGRFEDYRSSVVHGEGIDVGIDGTGRVFIGDVQGRDRVDLSAPLQVGVEATQEGSRAVLTVRVATADGQTEIARLTRGDLDPADLTGGLALLSDFGGETAPGASAAFSGWVIDGTGITADSEAGFGPVMFAQYTLHRGVLKLTAQLAPVDDVPGLRATLEIRTDGGRWVEVGVAAVDALSRTARFRVESWDASNSIAYRVRLLAPPTIRWGNFEYRGTVAAEPQTDRPLKAAVFSCNADHGFPDGEVVRHVTVHDPDLCLFLGDQFYESSGGFGIQTDSVEEAALDMLHKWYMFGWSYRELFRHVPAAFIPDDHDVYHGNVWGEGGKIAPTDEGWGAEAQDQGGYKMPAEWVKAVERAQTSHLPDPVDPAPVEQGIGVYFTEWNYGGVSFAILEDRKFKSAPKNVLPPEADVWNGWIQNPDFDVREHRDLPGAVLLGERQMRFLESWSEDWSGSAHMKVVLSQTNFAAVHTIPADATSGAVLPSLPMPEPGEYVLGDKLAVDMDSNGWPQKQRDEVLRLLRTCAAFHIAGDQHLATVVRHGIDAFGDAGFSFTGPALNNIWPRRWWPPAEAIERPLEDGAPYAGDVYDGFGNRVTVHAAANPRNTGLEPSILRDRVTGYGMVTFDPRAERIRIECWPRHVDPADGDGGQYRGWPIEIARDDGDGRTPVGRPARVEVVGLTDPVVQLRTVEGTLLSARRSHEASFDLPLLGPGPYIVRVGDPDHNLWEELPLAVEDDGPIRFDFRPAP